MSDEEKAKMIQDAIDKMSANSGGDAGQKLDKILAAMGAMGARMDAIEAVLPSGKQPGEPELTAADAMAKRDAERKELTQAQLRCDSVAQMHGEKAAAPMSGEKPFPYRKRLLREYQRYSPGFDTIDLDTVTDPVVFQAVEAKVYADAKEAARRPTVTAGHLRAITRQDATGRTITEFHGSPSAWLNGFAGGRRAMKMLHRPSGLPTE